MCEQCREFNQKKYPDLGEGSSLNFEGESNLGVNADPKMGLRIYQERKVTYMGMEGVQSADEIECVYIPWETVLELIQDMGDLYMRGAPDMIKTLDWLRYQRRERD